MEAEKGTENAVEVFLLGLIYLGRLPQYERPEGEQTH